MSIPSGLGGGLASSIRNTLSSGHLVAGGASVHSVHGLIRTTASLLSINASLNDSEAVDDGSLHTVSTKATKPSTSTPSGARSPGHHKMISSTMVSPLASPMMNHRAKTAPGGRILLHSGGIGGVDVDLSHNAPPQGLDTLRWHHDIVFPFPLLSPLSPSSSSPPSLILVPPLVPLLLSPFTPHNIGSFAVNSPYQHALPTHPINTPCQLTLSTHPINSPSNTPHQHTL